MHRLAVVLADPYSMLRACQRASGVQAEVAGALTHTHSSFHPGALLELTSCLLRLVCCPRPSFCWPWMRGLSRKAVS